MNVKFCVVLLVITVIIVNMADFCFASSTEYLLGPDDTILVNVWGYEELKTEVKVRPDGMISLPLIGEVKVNGTTIAQLTKELTKGFSYYIKKPHVSVIVKEFKKKKIFVLGEVMKPGMYKIDDNGSLVEAISNAGGLTANGYWTKVNIVRNNTQEQKNIYIDLGRLLKDGDLSQNIQLQSDDVVFVPKNNHKLDISQIAQALSIITSVKYLTDK